MSNDKPLKIGIFGGTFDPPTLAHVTIVNEALKIVDKVIVVPTICNYYRSDKRYLFTFDEKVQMWVQLCSMIDGDVVIDQVEKDKDSKWRAIDTVEYIRSEYPDADLYYIMGEDSYNNFTTWHRYDDILRLCELILVRRGPGSMDTSGIPYSRVIKLTDLLDTASASKVRDTLINQLIDDYLSDFTWYNKKSIEG